MLEIARKFAALGESKEACKAYKLALNEFKDKEPAVEYECALHILQFGKDDDYKISYTCFKDLYNQGFAKDDILAIMDEAFYQPNIKTLKKRYEKNCRLLSKYPYIFRYDFPAFEDLPVIFFPYDDNQYTPFEVSTQIFFDFFDPQNQVISRNFFKDLAKPILAADVFSQYELEYLNDNVRKSEWVARENHIYLHYTNWPTFCAYLQVLDLQALLKDKKIVFLIEDEIEQYPIDFKERFGIDYSKYKVKPVGIREINRLIWHTQLSSHNGGDFFNEIFDSHPNLLSMPSLIFDEVLDTVLECTHTLQNMRDIHQAEKKFLGWNNKALVAELFYLSNRTEKDVFIAIYLRDKDATSPFLDINSRIVPAIFFQPHFHNISYEFHSKENGQTELYSLQYDKICQSPLLCSFKYIKTFTPMRRITSSYSATIKFMFMQDYKKRQVMDYSPVGHIMNRSFMIDWQNRLFMDCRLVRFEDGKLNPKATFVALAEFLDLPYTDSMTYCSLCGVKNPISLTGNDVGFSTAAVYRTYDEYSNDSERAYIEYFMRDVYEYYGYDFHYYNGKIIDEDEIQRWVNNFDKIDTLICESWKKVFLDTGIEELEESLSKHNDFVSVDDISIDKFLEDFINNIKKNRLQIARSLMRGLNFVNKNGQPLHMMPKLELDPELLEQPLYR